MARLVSKRGKPTGVMAQLFTRLNGTEHAGTEQLDDLYRAFNQLPVARDYGAFEEEVVLEPDPYVAAKKHGASVMKIRNPSS